MNSLPDALSLCDDDSLPDLCWPGDPDYAIAADVIVLTFFDTLRLSSNANFLLGCLPRLVHDDFVASSMPGLTTGYDSLSDGD